MALVQVKKGGPYPKSEQRKRREEVYKLHFDYGYSARKIAEFLKVNRGTINRDVMFWYADVTKKWRHIDSEFFVMRQIERFQIQRTRLREQLDIAETNKEKITIEKFLFDVDVKITDFQIRFSEARRNAIELAGNVVNNMLDKQKKNKRLISKYRFYEVSKKALDKINKIYDEDIKF